MQKTITLSTSKKRELVDITQKIREIVKESNAKTGLCNIYCSHATAGITINENADPMIQEDLLELFSKLIPDGKWKHDRIDQNGAAHMKSSLIGVSQTIPIAEGKLMLGHWQDIFFCEFDGPRGSRSITVTILREE